MEIVIVMEYGMKSTNCKWTSLLTDIFPVESVLRFVTKIKMTGRICGINSVFVQINEPLQLPHFWIIADIFFRWENVHHFQIS